MTATPDEPDLFQWTPPKPKQHYDGPEYVPERDHGRLSAQTQRVFDLMRDARWRTLDEIAAATGDPHASISAQLRHLRKPRFGSHQVKREHVSDGLYRYRLIENKEKTR